MSAETAGYSGTPLWKKLGYRAGLNVFVTGAPDKYVELLGLPADVAVVWAAKPARDLQFVHHFTRSKTELTKALKFYREHVQPDAAVWISWPKKAAQVETDVTENVIRDLALPLGFVDVKVCAVDAVWSGLKLVVRKTQR